jgi:hypothetical protein
MLYNGYCIEKFKSLIERQNPHIFTEKFNIFIEHTINDIEFNAHKKRENLLT